MPTELELLQKIAENTAQNRPLYVALVAAGAAILGSIVTAFASYAAIARNAKTQAETERKKLQATIVTAERLRWLQDLRNKVSEFYAQIEVQLSHLEFSVDQQQGATEEGLRKLSAEARRLCYPIFPMLDKTKHEQAALIKALESSINWAGESGSDEKQVDRALFAQAKSEAFSSLEAIGRKAWIKVQNLE